MRTIVDLPADQIEGLAELCQREGIPRTEAIRRAVAAYLEAHEPRSGKAFGLWADRGIDSLKYEETLREEWERDS